MTFFAGRRQKQQEVLEKNGESKSHDGVCKRQVFVDPPETSGGLSWKQIVDSPPETSGGLSRKQVVDNPPETSGGLSRKQVVDNPPETSGGLSRKQVVGDPPETAGGWLKKLEAKVTEAREEVRLMVPDSTSGSSKQPAGEGKVGTYIGRRGEAGKEKSRKGA